MVQTVENEEFYGTGINIVLFICMCFLVIITALLLFGAAVSFNAGNAFYSIITFILFYLTAFGSYLLLHNARGEYLLKYVKFSFEGIKNEFLPFNIAIGRIILLIIAIIIALFIVTNGLNLLDNFVTWLRH